MVERSQVICPTKSGNNIRWSYIPLLRENDQYIMEAAEEAGFCDSAVRFMNYCRLYLNVISLADITNESGMTIDSRVLKQKEIPQQDEDSGLIRQKKPDCTKWSIWFKFLKTLLRPRQSKLKVPLGAWTAGYSTIRKKFKSYRTEDKLYQVQNGIIAEHSLPKALGRNGSVKNMSILMLSQSMPSPDYRHILDGCILRATFQA
jgi:hypothetical protein